MADYVSSDEEFPTQNLPISMCFFGDIKLFLIFCFIVYYETSVGWNSMCTEVWHCLSMISSFTVSQNILSFECL